MGGKLPPYAVAESDNNPVVYQPWKIIFPNGTITDVGDGTVYVGIGTSISTTTSITVSSYDVRTPILAAGTILSFLTNGTISTFLNGAGNYTSVYDARSPLLLSGTILSIKTDGTITNYLRGDGTYHSVYEVRSPLVSAGTIISIITDGSTTNFMRGDGTLAVPSSNSGVKIILFTVYSSTSWTAENIPIGQAPFETPITIKQVNATVSGGASPELGFNIDHRLWGGLATAGTNVFANTQSANSTGFQVVSFTSANIPAKAHLILVSSAVITGNVDYITGAIFYTRDSI